MIRNSFCIFFLILLTGSFVHSQEDTTWIQALTFDQITQRRDTVQFPDNEETYRKIMMIYTLKCDPRTTADGYACGEWDYLTYNYIYDHNATYDSTFQSRRTYRLGGNEPDVVHYTNQQPYDFTFRELTSIEHDQVLAIDSFTIGDPDTSSDAVLNISKEGSKNYFLITSQQLSAAGLTEGEISGMNFLVNNSTHDRLPLSRVRIAGTSTAMLSTVNLKQLQFETLYEQKPEIAEGRLDFQFIYPYYWQSSENIVLEITIDASKTDGSVELAGFQGSEQGFHSGYAGHAVEFSKNSSYISIDKTVQIDENKPRTYEMWAYTRSFNNAGLFQAGVTGSANRDFSLRTMGADNRWRAQLWGSDFDLTLNNSKNEWHHFALTYNGTNVYLYYDGKQVAKKTVALNTGDHDLWIGRWRNAYFDGMIDEVRVWNTALTESEINQWMYRQADTTHPQIANLVAYYPMNEGQGTTVSDHSANMQAAGQFSGLPWWQKLDGFNIHRGFELDAFSPQIQFERGTYVSTYSIQTVKDSFPLSPRILLTYDNPANGTLIDDHDPQHPNKVTSRDTVWPAGYWLYFPNLSDGTIYDSSWVWPEISMDNVFKEWYSPTVAYEIGRFITPYGINLDLGPDGFTWTYDVTDYAGLLKGAVDLSAGNNQELIDLKFMLIEGVPPREVLDIDRVWGGRASYSYRNLDNDVSLASTAIKKHPTASQFKLKSRITGHGHNSSDGNYPHCCEWKDNTHYLYVNGEEVSNWHIWQYDECALNPVFPQGGTWPGAREGWCPGDVVKEWDFEINDQSNSDSIVLDYDITDVPLDNAGMGNGNYVMAMHLFQYGAQNATHDAEIVKVLSPNNNPYQSRNNPTCAEPVIVIRNNGSMPLNSLEINYHVQGGSQETYYWPGNLAPNESMELTLPLSKRNFWAGNTDNPIFNVSIANPNGQVDENPSNNQAQIDFTYPRIFNSQLKIELNTNNVGHENHLFITDMFGDTITTLTDLDNNTKYTEITDLDPGCYNLKLLDDGHDGLSYWANPGQGNGSLWIRRADLNFVVESFQPEFGKAINYSFAIESLSDLEDIKPANIKANVFPNPGSDFVEINWSGSCDEIIIYDAVGSVLERVNKPGHGHHLLNTSDYPESFYLIKLLSNNRSTVLPLIIQHK